jgi:predicted nucleic acid-binding protein
VDRPLILDTTYLLDLEREHNTGSPGPALAFLEANAGASLYLPFVVPGELAAAGASQAGRSRWEAFLAPFYVLPHTAEVSWEFGRALRHLRATGQVIDTNDLWIAATGLAYQMAVVTRHVAHYRRVPDLDVEGYGAFTASP